MIGSGDRLSDRRSAETEPSAFSTAPTPTIHGSDARPTPMAISDPRLPLLNLSILGQKMDSLRQFLSDSVDRHASINGDHLHIVSTEIAAAVHQIILNGAALLASSYHPPVLPDSMDPKGHDLKAQDPRDLVDPRDPNGPQIAGKVPDLVVSGPDPKDPTTDDDGDSEIVEIGAAELMAEHVHFCEICGKGFKRDANLRMHMRAHGNQFKTLEALSKPDHHRSDDPPLSGRRIKFSCPFVGCNRNRAHKQFRPLKSAVCVKNHFKRSHCPKMYSCNRCNKKSFSVVADLKSHLKHCGESRWRCSCGTRFSRKDKLFGHVGLFEGHVPVVVGEEEGRGKEVVVEEEEDDRGGEMVGEGLDPEFFEGLMEEIGGIGGVFG